MTPLCACCGRPLETYQLHLTRDDGEGRVRIHVTCMGRDLEQQFRVPRQQPREPRPGQEAAS